MMGMYRRGYQQALLDTAKDLEALGTTTERLWAKRLRGQVEMMEHGYDFADDPEQDRAPRTDRVDPGPGRVHA